MVAAKDIKITVIEIVFAPFAVLGALCVTALKAVAQRAQWTAGYAVMYLVFQNIQRRTVKRAP